MFTFVTSNEEKIFFAKKALQLHGISCGTANLEIEEIQSASSDHIIRRKAASAYSILKKPIVVNDHFWELPALHGFPGAYMKYMNDWLTSQDLLRLVGPASDRRAVLTESICYMDGTHQEVFTEQIHGTILEKAEGNGLPCQEIVSLSGDGHSIAYHLNHGTEPRGKKSREVWDALAEFLLSMKPLFPGNGFK